MTCNCTARTFVLVSSQLFEKLPTGGYKEIAIGKCRRCGEWRKLFTVIDSKRCVFKDLVLRPGEARGEGATRREFNHDEIPKENT
jgi:hypothetical protein